MSAGDCRQTHRVEALRDGRLQASEAAAVEWHLQSCAVCAEELRRFDALRQKLVELPEGELDSGAIARSRGRLLEKAARSGRAEAQIRSRAPTLAWASAALVAAVLVLSFLAPWRTWHLPGSSAPLEEAASPVSGTRHAPRAEITARAGAHWTRRSTPNEELVELQDGELEIRVRHHEPGFRFLVRMPDGEIEDIGTTFTVNVCDGHTERVAVKDGSVMLRLRERQAITLRAGEHWESPTASHDAAQEHEHGSAEATRGAPEPRSHDVQASEAAAARATSAKATTANACLGGATFERANTAYKQARWQSAALAFAQFAAECPRDSRAEDAAYLRMVALARAGRSVEARSAARTYLARFPTGFRRKEAQRLASAE